MGQDVSDGSYGQECIWLDWYERLIVSMGAGITWLKHGDLMLRQSHNKLNLLSHLMYECSVFYSLPNYLSAAKMRALHLMEWGKPTFGTYDNFSRLLHTNGRCSEWLQLQATENMFLSQLHNSLHALSSMLVKNRTCYVWEATLETPPMQTVTETWH